MIAALLGLASALSWGTADFLGGMQSRRLPVFAVVFWSQLAGGLMIVAALVSLRVPPTSGSVVWGMAGGVFGVIALLLFYRGLATGVMSIVAPVSACGVLLPVLFSMAMGHIPTPPTALGLVVAIVGMVLVSLQPAPIGSDIHVARRALVLAFGAACGFGLFFVCTNLGATVHDGSPLWTIAGVRFGSLLLLAGVIGATRASAPWPGRHAPQVAVVGVLDTGANVLFALATTQGQLAIVAVLGALYPVATVLLGQIILHERLSRLQGGGVGLALAGVILLSMG